MYIMMKANSKVMHQQLARKWGFEILIFIRQRVSVPWQPNVSPPRRDPRVVYLRDVASPHIVCPRR